jgi:16S rRNA (cytidine1402-2'-O)-methyltransferase
LVSDAGTPAISDPGAVLVRAARKAGVRVEPIPGPSAVTAVLSASGLEFDRFAFAGFPPVRAKDRKLWFQWVERLCDTPVVFFEAPHRVARTLRDCRSILANRPIIMAREVTKAHEEWLSGDAEPRQQGEFVVVIGSLTEDGAADATSDPARATSDPARATSDPTPATSDPEQRSVSLDSLDAVSGSGGVNPQTAAKLFGDLTKNGSMTSRRDVVRAVALKLGVSTKAVYDALERAKT